MNHPTDNFGNARATTEEVLRERSTRNGTASRGLTALVEPVYQPDVSYPVSEALADHPLLRGLLQELPPRGSAAPSVEWLDRWFEATRSILELLYAQAGYKIGA